MGMPSSFLTRQALGVGATRDARGGGHEVAPSLTLLPLLHICTYNISATRKRRIAKVFSHLPEYLAGVISKFIVSRTSDDVILAS